MKLNKLLKSKASQIDFCKGVDNACVQLFHIIRTSKIESQVLLKYFQKAYKENPKLALKILMYTRDIRHGLGKREIFRMLFNYLCKKYPHIARQLVSYLSSIGRFDDLFVGLHTNVEDTIIEYIDKTLQNDIENFKMGRSVSLLGKWMPSINSSNKEIVKLAKYLANKLDMSEDAYVKIITMLRNRDMVENRSKENIRLEKTCKSSKDCDSLDMVSLIESCYDNYQLKDLCVNEEITLQEKWEKVLKKGFVDNTIVIRDGSYSMTCDNGVPLFVANIMTAYFSRLLNDDCKNKFLTFSDNPELVEFTSESLYRMLKQLEMYDDSTNLDLSKAFDIIMSKIESVRRIVIITDMNFDVGVEDVDSLEIIKNQFANLHLEIPEIVYWNVNSSNIDYKVDNNIKYITGVSNKIIDLIMNNNHVNDIFVIEECVDKYKFIDNLEV